MSSPAPIVEDPPPRAPPMGDPMTCPRCKSGYAADFEYCPRDGCRLESIEMPFSDAFIGTVIDGRYRVVGVLGRGASGTVYRAEQMVVSRPVAIKVIAPDASGEARRVRRFEQEARTVSRLRHPNTLKLVDFGRLPDGRPYIVNILLEGRSLAEVLNERTTLGIGETLTIMGAVCDALTEAHALGIVHRDLKPENIFIETVAGQEVVKVIDFGVARLVDHDPKLTEDGTAMGTVPYMSPEQVRGEAVGPSSDLYSLGIVGYECLTGRAPFVGANYLSIAMKHLSEAPEALATRAPLAIRPYVDHLIMGCLEKLPADRPADAMALRTGIDQCMRRMRAPDTPIAPPEEVQKAVSPRWWIAAGLGVALLAALALILPWFRAPLPPEAPLPAAILAAPVTVLDARVRDASRPDAKVVDARVPAPDAAVAPASIGAPPSAAPRTASPKTSAPRLRPATPRTAPRKPPPGLY